MKNVDVINKQLYKVFLLIIKYIPNILAICKILGLILSYFGITSFCLTCFSGTSIVFLILLYLVSYIFKFCGIHRLSLHYVSTVYLLTILDYYFGANITAIVAYKIYAILSGLFIISWIITWYKNRNNPKVDHIKQLCDTYCGC